MNFYTVVNKHGTARWCAANSPEEAAAIACRSGMVKRPVNATVVDITMRVMFNPEPGAKEIKEGTRTGMLHKVGHCNGQPPVWTFDNYPKD